MPRQMQRQWQRGSAEDKEILPRQMESFWPNEMRTRRGSGSRGCSGWVMVTTTSDSRLIEMRVCIDKKQNGIRAKHSRGHDSLIMRPGH